MRDNPVTGLAETYSLLARIPDAARDQLGVEIARIGYDVLAGQRRDVAKATGALDAGLGVQLQIDQLRARIGLIGIKARSTSALRRARREGRSPGESFGDLYYGRFVEYGRRAQVVLVQRRRRVGGRLRSSRGRKHAEDVGATYAMKVPAMAPRPYVHVDRPEIHAEQRLANFWGQVMANAGAAT
jgi:hypothetical protein